MEPTIKEVVASVSRELASLANLTSALQERLSPRGVDDLDIEAFQNLDSVTQTLTCLATFLAVIETTVPCTCRITTEPAISEVSLSALKKRLQGEREPQVDTEFLSWELF